MKISTTKTKPNAWIRHLQRAGVLVFWITLWWIVSAIVGKSVLLPSPWQVACVLAKLCLSGSFWLSILYTLVRILIGYALGCVCGVLAAAICFRFRAADLLLAPLFSVIRAVPVASFIILALVWMGRSAVPGFISFLMVLPIIAGNVRTALHCVNHELWEVTVLYRLSLKKKIYCLYAPSVLPYFRSAARTSLGLAWKAGVAAEVLCSLPQSIGGKIYESKLYLETDALFAWTVTVILISLLIEKLLFHANGKEDTSV